MTRKPILTGVLSLLVPGLGQICSGRGERGVGILLAAILVGNLNVIWLSLYGRTSSGGDTFWTYPLPRILHDVFAAWSLVFYIWQTIDAYRQVH
jgi:TM2 domain-containing membrane protein YozV